jgi:hypothetical protein
MDQGEMSERHVAEVEERCVGGDTSNPDHWMEYEYFCGDWRSGEQVLCAEHFAQAQKDYPQGWHHYPGDVCPHGKYTGGSGVDLMCGYCEVGLTTWVKDPSYSLRFRLVDYITDWIDGRVRYRASQIGDPDLNGRVLAFAQRIDNALQDGVHFEMQAIEESTGYWSEG